MSKIRESDMPGKSLWHTFFDAETVLTKLGLNKNVGDAVDFGCGYGTFSLFAASLISGTLHGFDIEPAMIAECECRAANERVHNVRFHLRDLIVDGTGLDGESVDYVMMFNILHTEEPLILLCEAWRVLRDGGRLAITHWNYDPKTPRGPSMGIRPRPEQCRFWAEEAGFICETEYEIDLPPHHYGWLLCKSSNEVTCRL